MMRTRQKGDDGKPLAGQVSAVVRFCRCINCDEIEIQQLVI